MMVTETLYEIISQTPLTENAVFKLNKHLEHMSLNLIVVVEEANLNQLVFFVLVAEMLRFLV